MTKENPQSFESTSGEHFRPHLKKVLEHEEKREQNLDSLLSSPNVPSSLQEIYHKLQGLEEVINARRNSPQMRAKRLVQAFYAKSQVFLKKVQALLQRNPPLLVGVLGVFLIAFGLISLFSPSEEIKEGFQALPIEKKQTQSQLLKKPLRPPVVSMERVRLRQGPGTSFAILTVLAPNHIFEVIERRPSWIHIQFYDFVAKKLYKGWAYEKSFQVIENAKLPKK